MMLISIFVDAQLSGDIVATEILPILRIGMDERNQELRNLRGSGIS